MNVCNKNFSLLVMVTLISFAQPMAAYLVEEKYTLEDGWQRLPVDVKKIIMHHVPDLWNAIDFLAWQPERTLEGHTDSVILVAIAEDKIITASYDRTVRIWDLKTGQRLHTLNIGCYAESVAMSDNRLLIGLGNGTIMVCDLESGRHHTFKAHTRPIKAMAIVYGKLVTGSSDTTAKIWDLKTEKLLHTLGHAYAVSSLAIADDKLVVGSWPAKVWNLDTGELLHTFDEGYPDRVMLVAITNGNIVTLLGDGTSRMWDLRTGAHLHTFKRSVCCLSALAIVDNTIVNGPHGVTAQMRNLETGKLLHTLYGHTSSISSLAIAHDKIVSGSADRTAKIWDLKPFDRSSKTHLAPWVLSDATIPQLDLIKRACKATKAKKDFVITLISEDTKVFLSIAKQMRLRLLDCLNIKLYDPKPTSLCAIQ